MIYIYIYMIYLYIYIYIYIHTRQRTIYTVQVTKEVYIQYTREVSTMYSARITRTHVASFITRTVSNTNSRGERGARGRSSHIHQSLFCKRECAKVHRAPVTVWLIWNRGAYVSGGLKIGTCFVYSFVALDVIVYTPCYVYCTRCVFTRLLGL